MNSNITPVIMCGGAGSRLWPASRESYPKQLISFGDGGSLLQNTLARVTGDGYGPAIVITGEEHRFLVAEQVRASGCKAEIVLEPARRDSCAAVTAACALAAQTAPDALVLVLAADHAIPDAASFNEHVMAGAGSARDGRLVTFGIRPTEPATGYGYIRPGRALDGEGRVREIEAFVEKPARDVAERYLADGYLWNSGNFLFRADVFLSEVARLAPDIHDPVVKSVAEASRDLDFVRLQRDAFLAARPQSVDFAVMEKTRLAAVVPSDFAWSDIGSWAAVWQLADKDAGGNAAMGDAMFHDARNCHVHTTHQLTAVVGLEDVVVVATRDALLVAAKSAAEQVKNVVSALNKAGRREASEHLRMFRPWGDYEQIDRGARYQVKRITVKPGGTLSLQSHVHRSEHWVVVSGSAQVWVGDEIKLLQENQSVYIPLGAKHRLQNPGKIPLELIEVQSGSYLGEDDIIRYEDVYNRV
jgi:mannose-1-phosphate guanylyltransferase/mannose-6-phosphate isomerase